MEVYIIKLPMARLYAYIYTYIINLRRHIYWCNTLVHKVIIKLSRSMGKANYNFKMYFTNIYMRIALTCTLRRKVMRSKSLPFA